MSDFCIRIANDSLTFAAAHFIILEGGICERLHGHDFRVVAELHGPLNESQYVVDFLAAEEALKAIIAELDHRLLLPTGNPAIRVTSGANEVEVIFADRRWVFPQDDCRLLPMANTTTELLAQHVGQQLLAALKSSCGIVPDRARIEIAEGASHAAVCELRSG